MIRIGPYSLENSVALAPMAGVTDLPFRRLCKRLGAGLVISEMVTSDSTLWNSQKTRLRLQHSAEENPRSVQIAGSDPQSLALAAEFNVAQGAQIIDINMGCPAKKVCRKAAGSSLLRDEKLVEDILTTVVKAVGVPVTLKIRTGWSPEERNGVTIAKIAEQAGVQALAVHGRTRSCRFNGEAEFGTIRDICSAISIPVFANGDITSPERAKAIQDYCGSAGVMIGRAAQGRPWLPGQIAHFLDNGELLPEPELEQQRDIIIGHLGDLHQFYGEYLGPRIARKHISWYIQNLETSTAVPDSNTKSNNFRSEFNKIENPEQQLGALQHFFSTRIGEAQVKELAA
jgi:tRNA-dihydrouridine synthase B